MNLLATEKDLNFAPDRVVILNQLFLCVISDWVVTPDWKCLCANKVEGQLWVRVLNVNKKHAIAKSVGSRRIGAQQTREL